MFLASSSKAIDLQLRDLVEQIEQQSPGLSVLAARQFRYSLHQTPVELTISEPRKLNVLEEFVLRAGIELAPSPTEDELAAVLGLDPVFVRSTAATLRTLQILARASRIAVTPQGRQFYEQGTVPQPPYHIEIYAIADPLVGNLAFESSPLNQPLVNQPDLADFVTIENSIPDVSSLQLEELQQLVQASGLGLHVPSSGKIVTSYRVAAPTQTIWKTMSLFVLFDVLEDKVRLQVRRGKQILEEASNWLEALQAEGKVSLNALCEISEQEPNIQLLREGWCQVMGAIANLEPNVALMLLSDEAWTQFSQLGVAHLPIDSLEKFISKDTLVQNKPEENSKMQRQQVSKKKSKPKK